MAAITWTDVTNATSNDPIIANFAVGGQALILAVVNKTLAVSLFDGEDGDITKLARCFLAAHMAASSKLGATGAVTGESEGGVSRQYAAPLHLPYHLTSYGLIYLELIPGAARAPRVL